MKLFYVNTYLVSKELRLVGFARTVRNGVQECYLSGIYDQEEWLWPRPPQILETSRDVLADCNKDIFQFFFENTY